MRIGFDISHSLGNPSGLGRYASGLLHGLVRSAPEHQFLAYPFFYEHFPAQWRRAQTPAAPNVRVNRPPLPRPIIGRMLAHGGVIAELLFGDVDITHSNGTIAPILRRSRLVYTVYDCTVFLMPELHDQGNVEVVSRNMRLAAERAVAIIADSESTRTDYLATVPADPERVSVVYGAADARFNPLISESEIQRVRARYGIGREYVLAVGTTEPRKNLFRLIRAFESLSSHHRDVQLVVAGRRGWLSEPLYEYVEQHSLEDTVRFAGYVDAGDLPALYAGATVFAYPSLYEGFGLPLVEAMASGVPVLTSNRSSLPEVAGDAAILVNPEDEAEIAGELVHLLEDEQLRRELTKEGIRQAARFSWESSAKRLLQVYERVIADATL